MNLKPKTQATEWRSQHGYTGKGGVIVIYAGEVQSWVNELRDPQHWRPGCIAVDDAGQCWISTGGTNYDGAHQWEPLTHITNQELLP